MRRATSPQHSEAEARRAADRLKESHGFAGRMRQQQASSRLGSLADETSRLAKEQRDQADRIHQAFGQQGGQPGSQAGLQDKRKIADDRQRLAEDLAAWKRKCRNTTRELATNKQNAASTKLREALSDMQQSDLRSRVQRGADWMRRGIDPNASGATGNRGRDAAPRKGSG